MADLTQQHHSALTQIYLSSTELNDDIMDNLAMQQILASQKLRQQSPSTPGSDHHIYPVVETQAAEVSHQVNMLA